VLQGEEAAAHEERSGSGAQASSSGRRSSPSEDSFEDEEAVNETLAQLLMVMEKLDDRIGPMLEQDGRHFNLR
jgi:hypothetical protein